MSAMSNPKEPILMPAFVLYADILGFRDLTKRAFEAGKGTDFLRRIKRSLDSAYEVVREAGTWSEEFPYPLDIKFFTDNVVVAYPLSAPEHDYGESELIELLMLFAYVQAILAADGFFLRGAIAYGDHYQDDAIVYGDALIEAYELDLSGGPPRLVIAPSAECQIRRQLTSYGGLVPHHDLLLEDPADGSLFVNYLETAYSNLPDAPVDQKLLATHGTEVGKNLQEYIRNPRVGKKYEWVAVYHNYVCRSLAERYPYLEDEGTDPETWLAGEDARRALEHLVPVEPPQPPRPLDAQRLWGRNPDVLCS